MTYIRWYSSQIRERTCIKVRNMSYALLWNKGWLRIWPQHGQHWETYSMSTDCRIPFTTCSLHKYGEMNDFRGRINGGHKWMVMIWLVEQSMASDRKTAAVYSQEKPWFTASAKCHKCHNTTLGPIWQQLHWQQDRLRCIWAIHQPYIRVRSDLHYNSPIPQRGRDVHLIVVIIIEKSP